MEWGETALVFGGPRRWGDKVKRPGALPLDPTGAVGPRPHFISSEIGIGCATAVKIHRSARSVQLTPAAQR